MNEIIHIGFDIRKYRDFGIGTYIQNLLDQFSMLSQNGMTLFAAPDDAAVIEAKYGRNAWKTEINASPKYSVQELISLSRQARAHHIDVLHCPHYTLPFRLRSKSVVTIHDLIQLRFPEYFSLPQRLYAKMMIGHACASADRIIVDSHFTQTDIEREFPKSIGKIETIHLGVSERFGKRLPEEENEKFLRRFGLATPYILYVGSAKPHKNIGTLLKAYQQSAVRGGVHLVSAGEPLSRNADAAPYLADEALRHCVHDLGHVNNGDLASAYQNARAVVLPSRYEGFGFSVIEAMKAGVPVIGARAASIPEVMGDAGLLFDPNSPDELAGLLEKVVADEELRCALIAKGTERAAQFTWEACAKKTMDTYYKALQ